VYKMSERIKEAKERGGKKFTRNKQDSGGECM
jgi:hypothetical protein